MTTIIVFIALVAASVVACCVGSCLCRARKRVRARRLVLEDESSTMEQLRKIQDKSKTLIPAAADGSAEFQFNLHRHGP